ncbi:hypothetical protein ACNFIC_12575 [Pseudomonas sp. NY15463]|uniref:hypothetical protein n=1 Tax=Pseudomonas sp. NY15463 TaxID=3400361 RepID=UPI003A877824
MRLVPSLLTASVVVSLYGCAVPSTKYTLYDQNAERVSIDSTADTYMLAKSQLTISKKISEEDGNATDAIEVALRKIEDTRLSLGITPWNRWYGVKTRIALTKVDNTQLVQTVTVEVEDKRKEFIQSAFTLLGTIAKLPISEKAEGEAKPVFKAFPAVIDASEAIRECRRNKCEKTILNASEWGVQATISVAPVPPDAVDVKHLNDPGFLQSAKGVFFASACRQATIRVSKIENSDVDFVQHFSLADPNFVQIIALPANGSITAHAECGYSVVAQDVELQEDTDVANTFFVEYYKIQDALHKKRKESDSESEYENGDE